MRKPRLSFWQIWNMSFGFLGIQFGFALQNGNASRILQDFGADVHELSWFWLVAPITGLIVQPIIGHYSDRTWNRLGRRVPYFLVGALLAAGALTLLPNSDVLATFLPSLLVGAGMLMIMDASFNVAMEPFRALVADMLPEEQRTKGFAVQTLLIGIGAVIGSWLPYILANWFGLDSSTGAVADNVIIAFYIGAAVIIFAILVTVITTKEYPPEEYKKYFPVENEEEDAGLKQIFKDFANMPAKMKQLGGIQFLSWFALFGMWVFTTPALTRDKYDMNIEKIHLEIAKEQVLSYEFRDDHEEIDPAVKEGLLASIDEALAEEGEIVFLDKSVASKLLEAYGINQAFQQEVSSQILGRDTLGMGNTVSRDLQDGKLTKEVMDFLQKNPNRLEDTPFKENLATIAAFKKVEQNFNEGSDWVGILFGIYNGIAAIYALLLTPVARRFGRKTTHAINLAICGISFISIFFINDVNLLILPMIGIGMAWASILAMPYAMLAGSIPAGKMGVYMGIFNFFIVIPQIVNGIIGGPMVKYLYGDRAIFAIVLAGVSMLLAAYLTTRLKDTEDVVPG